jgi:hypothetical protein
MCANVAILGIPWPYAVAVVGRRPARNTASVLQRPGAALLAPVGKPARHPGQHRREPVEAVTLECERRRLPVPAQ